MSTGLVSVKEKIKQELAESKKTLPAVGGRNVSTKNKLFTLPDGTTSKGPLSVIILGWRNFNQYYDGVYNATKLEPPKCFAIGQIIEDMKPHENASVPQHEDCKSCPFNQFKSAPNGGAGKACKNQVRIAMISADLNAADQDPVIIKASPTAIRQWSMYAGMLTANGVHPMEMITEIGFDANAAYPTLTFNAIESHGRDIDAFAAQLAKADTLLDSAPVSNAD